MAGFRGPLFLLGLSAPVERAGFRNPLPIPPLAGTAPTQAGFVGPIPLINLGAHTDVSLGGPSDGAVRHPLQDDEEVIMLVARAFLTLVN